MYRNLLFYVLFIFVFQIGYSQSDRQQILEKKRANLQKEIAKVNKLLFNTQKEGKSVLNDLKNINHKVSVREKLIKAIEDEAKYLQHLINKDENKKTDLEKDLENLKQDYAEMILQSYKSKSEQSKLMFLLSSENFQQVYKRYRYMQQYADYRKKQGDSIVAKAEKLRAHVHSLKQQKQKKNLLLQTNLKEQELFTVEKEKQEGLLKKVKRRATTYKRQIQKKEAEERKLNAKIEKIIKEAIAAANKKALKDAKITDKKASSTEFALTPEAKALAASFEKSRGKLPWPVTEGVVTRNYGVGPHPTMRGIKIDSKGIHITTKQDAIARAVFKGKVLTIQFTGKYAVYVQHGNYISVYSNLNKVYVSKGQEVGLKQALGTVFKDKITGETILKFQVWKDSKTQNPKYWLASM